MIDRIVATVNGHIILLSDWEDSLRYEAFSAGRPLASMTAEDRKAALDRLIDQELLREQQPALRTLPHASSEEVAQRVAEIRKQYPEAETELGWQASARQVPVQRRNPEEPRGDGTRSDAPGGCAPAAHRSR